MQQLTPQDAVFVSIETDELPAHIGGLSFLEPTEGRPFDFETFVEFARERLAPCERFSWRLQEVPFGLDRPYWVRCDGFDPADHIDRIAVPTPYSDESLARLVGMLFERPLDRTRPLWEMTLIEGLPGGRFVLLWKVHHCLMDGGSGASLSEQLFDLAPDAERPAPARVADDARAGGPVGATSLVSRGLRNLAKVRRNQVRLLTRATREIISGDTSESPVSEVPRVPFNDRVGVQRGLVWSSVSLDDVKRLKNALSVTVNDIILSITAGALRDYLSARDALPDASLVASVPCSTRTADDHRLGNQVSDMPVRWSTDVEDPLERVMQIHEDASRAKQAAREGPWSDLIGLLGEAMLPGGLQLLIRGAAAAANSIPLQANAVVSNVAMTPFPLYCAGAKITKAVPISLLAPTQGLNMTVLSYCGELHFGIVHDPRLLPDPWELAGRIGKQLMHLQDAVDRRLEADPATGAQVAAAAS